MCAIIFRVSFVSLIYFSPKALLTHRLTHA